MKKIPEKNYIILAVVILITIGLTFYFRNWYQMSLMSSGSKNILAEKLPELKLEEMDNFLRENPNIIIYISSSTDEKNTEFEKKLYQYIVGKEMTYDFVYLNKDEISDKEIIELQRKYGIDAIKNINMTYIPNFYVMQDGKITTFYNQDGEISYDKAIEFLQEVGV